MDFLTKSELSEVQGAKDIKIAELSFAKMPRKVWRQEFLQKWMDRSPLQFAITNYLTILDSKITVKD